MDALNYPMRDQEILSNSNPPNVTGATRTRPISVASACVLETLTGAPLSTVMRVWPVFQPFNLTELHLPTVT